MGLFKKVEEIKVALKVLAYGNTGSGKTSFALSFPEIAAVDSEDGMVHYRKNPNLKHILTSSSAQEVEEALLEIEDELLDDIKTFVLDSETKIYENQQHGALEVVEKRASRKNQSVDDANLSQREWGKIKLIAKRIKAGQIRLASKGINVVSISQEKEIKEKKGDNWVVVGNRPDSTKGIEYDFDIVLRFFTKEEKNGDTRYFAKVIKDRTQLYKKGAIIENPSFENWKEAYEGKIELKEEVRDFTKDIEKDGEGMKSDVEKFEEAKVVFSKLYAKLSDENKAKIKAILKAKAIDVNSVSSLAAIEKINVAMASMK